MSTQLYTSYSQGVRGRVVIQDSTCTVRVTLTYVDTLTMGGGGRVVILGLSDIHKYSDKGGGGRGYRIIISGQYMYCRSYSGFQNEQLIKHGTTGRHSQG